MNDEQQTAETAQAEDYEAPAVLATYSIEQLHQDAAVAATTLPPP
jgi:hypothetical protein